MEHGLLVLSDIHLGCDLVQQTRPRAPLRTDAATQRDAELVAMLDWYRERRRNGAPWRLIIAGDFIDFSGMSFAVDGSRGQTQLSPDEEVYGLGSTEGHSLLKLRGVVATHENVFSALARFAEDGNELVFVRGNHDVDLFWPAVQGELRKALYRRSHDNTRAEVTERVKFADWFYYEPGRVYVEHGHNYDQYCAHLFPLVPLDPRDPRRCARSLSDSLKRYVVNPTVGLTETGHEDAAMGDYLRLCGRLGFFGCLKLVGRFVGTVGRVLADALLRDRRGCHARAQEQQLRLEQLAQDHAMDRESLQSLAKFWQRPGTHNVASILGCLMLDRVLLAATVTLTWLLLFRLLGVTALSLLTALAVGLFGQRWATRLRDGRGPVDASGALLASALRVVNELNVELVIMGHTHTPVDQELRRHARYVNLGSWAEADPEAGLGAQPASRTHLVVPAGATANARLYQWHSLGPTEYRAQPAAQDVQVPTPAAFEREPRPAVSFDKPQAA